MRVYSVSSSPNTTSLQEYYQDEAVTQVYQDVMEKLLYIIFSADDKDEKDFVQSSTASAGIVEQVGENSWPPWPWPPWGDGDDGDDDKPVDKKKQAHKLAKEVLKFETAIANASLDLYVLHKGLSEEFC